MSERKDMWLLRYNYPSMKLRAGMLLILDSWHNLRLFDTTTDEPNGGTRVCWPLRGEGDDYKTRWVDFLYRKEDFAEFCETLAALCGLSIKDLKVPPSNPPWRGWEHDCSCLFEELREGKGMRGGMDPDHIVGLRADMQLFFNGHNLILIDMTEGVPPYDRGVRVHWPERGDGDDFKTREVKFLHRKEDFAAFCETLAALCGLSIEKLTLPPDAPSWRGWENRCSCLFGAIEKEGL